MNADKVFCLQVPKELNKKRLDFILATHHAVPSRAEAQRIIMEGKVATKPPLAKVQPKTVIASGVYLYFSLREIKTIDNLVPDNTPLAVVYEDSHLLVVNKPQGTVVHPAPGNYENTVVNQLLHHCQNLESDTVIRPGIVHRIDKETSGLLVIAKNTKTHGALVEQFAAHTVQREYRALVWGKLAPLKGTINKPIGRHKQNRQKQAIIQEGKQAITHYKLIQTFPCLVSYVACQLETGRTHQIRVHMHSIGHGLLGDTLYMQTKQAMIQKYPCLQTGLQKATGQFLHAKTLGFTHPMTGENMYFTSELPTLFSALLTQLQQI